MPLTFTDVGHVFAEGSAAQVRALAGVSLEVAPGTLTLIVGRTGTGKSTLLRIAAGLLCPTEGDVLLDGVSLDAQVARGRVGLVFQDAESQLFADTIVDDVMFGPANLGLDAAEARDRALAAMRAVGLEPSEYAERSPFSLSGGEARRAAIAGVLAMRPDYVLADEPTAGLDARGRRAVRTVLTQAASRTGVVVVTHSPEEFLSAASNVVVLDGGGVSWSGSVEELLVEPRVLTDAGLALPDLLEAQVRYAERRGVRFTPTLDVERAAALMAGAGGAA